jgi:hypothetical protein
MDNVIILFDKEGVQQRFLRTKAPQVSTTFDRKAHNKRVKEAYSMCGKGDSLAKR